MSNHRRKKSELSLLAKAEAALREAVAEVIEAHKRSGEPIVVWRDGRVVRVFPEQLVIREKPTTKYGVPSSRR